MNRRKAHIIGLTGNIATGKSSVAKMLRCLGAYIIDADAIAHSTMRRGSPVWQSIVDSFGEQVIAPDGEIDRAKLGAIVFADPEALRKLEKIVHPAVILETDRRIDAILVESEQTGARPVIVIEAIKLIESGMNASCDALWVVTCSPEQQKERVRARSGLSEAEAMSRIQAQPPQQAKIALADVVINNSGGLEDTWSQVQQEWNNIQRAYLDKKS